MAEPRVRLCIVVGISAIFATSCSPPDLAGPVRVHVDHPVALVDAPVSITLTGLRAATRVTIKASAMDCDATPYASQATFTSNVGGDLDLATAAAVSGAYSGVDGMGLIENLRPIVGGQTSFAFCVPETGFDVTLTVDVAGRDVAHATLTRLWSLPGVSERDLRPSAAGIYGDFLAPPTGVAVHPGILVFGGSEGGLSAHTEAASLASHGYPTLALAYFAEPGLPDTEQNIPLEYFVKALTWLAAQRGVDPHHLVVIGVSRGGEAALLLGAYYPNLVHAVIAETTSGTVLCGFDAEMRCDGPSWTLHGVALPYSTNFNDPSAATNPEQLIPVARIDGPILLNCGGQDLLIPSCLFGSAIEERLNAAHFPYPHQLLTYPDAGHLVNAGVPFDPIYIDGLGGTLEANELGVAAFWSEQLTFLAAVSK